MQRELFEKDVGELPLLFGMMKVGRRLLHPATLERLAGEEFLLVTAATSQLRPAQILQRLKKSGYFRRVQLRQNNFCLIRTV